LTTLRRYEVVQKSARSVRVLCAGNVPAYRDCWWEGRRVDGPRVDAPCPRCGGPVDVFRRGTKPMTATKHA
jgi:hypothetical protein